MVSDLLLQAGIVLLMLFTFLAMHNIPQKLFAKFRHRNRADYQAKRHFVLGAQLFSKARSTKSKSLAKQAESEADKAIFLDPCDAAAHILKGLSLDLRGFKSSALDSLDVALSPPAVGTLSDTERADAMFKRAEIKMAIGRRGMVDSAIEDLTQAVDLGGDCRAKALCLLGECYEVKQMRGEAKQAFDDSLKIDSSSAVARAALQRLGS